MKDPRRDWREIKETEEKLAAATRSARKDISVVDDCLVLAQKLNNQFDYFALTYDLPNEVVDLEGFAEEKLNRNKLYQGLYQVFDFYETEEIVNQLKKTVEEMVPDYQKRLEADWQDNKDSVWKILTYRDRFKLLFDELEIWLNKFKGEERGEWRRKDELSGQVISLDQNLYEGLLAVSREWLSAGADQEMILKPDGSDRFNFWWWYPETYVQ